MEALDLDYDTLHLRGIAASDIKRIIITNRGGSVTIKTSPESIAQFVKQHPSLAIEYRSEYGGYTTKSVGRYYSVCVEVR